MIGPDGCDLFYGAEAAVSIPGPAGTPMPKAATAVTVLVDRARRTVSQPPPQDKPCNTMLPVTQFIALTRRWLAHEAAPPSPDPAAVSATRPLGLPSPGSRSTGGPELARADSDLNDMDRPGSRWP